MILKQKYESAFESVSAWINNNNTRVHCGFGTCSAHDVICYQIIVSHDTLPTDWNSHLIIPRACVKSRNAFHVITTALLALESSKTRLFLSQLISSDFRTVHKHTPWTASIITIQRRWWLRWWLSFDGPLISIRHACVSFEVMRSGKKFFHGHFPSHFSHHSRHLPEPRRDFQFYFRFLLFYDDSRTLLPLLSLSLTRLPSFPFSWVRRRSAENKSIRATREN